MQDEKEPRTIKVALTFPTKGNETIEEKLKPIVLQWKTSNKSLKSLPLPNLMILPKINGPRLQSLLKFS